jgi:internalin A
VSDAAPLAGLAALQHLDLTGTQVSDVTPLAGLTALQTLDLARTRVSDVAPLAPINQLEIRGFTKKRGKRPIRAARRRLIGWRG